MKTLIYGFALLLSITTFGERWNLGLGGPTSESQGVQVCRCLCYAWKYQPIPSYGGYTRHAWGQGQAHSLVSGTVDYNQDVTTEAVCSLRNGVDCEGTDNFYSHRPRVYGYLHLCRMRSR